MLTLLLGASLSVHLASQSNADQSRDSEGPSYFEIDQLNGYHFLRDDRGAFFFSLGLNHVGSANKRFDVARVLSDLNQWGYNTCGYGCMEELKGKLPFIESVRLTSNGHYLGPAKFSFDDVFSTSFMDEVRSKIKMICLQHRENTNLVGYYWTDTPRWDISISRKRHGLDWVSYLRNLGPEAAGKKAYVDFLDRKYQSIEAFNKAYGLNFIDFASLRHARFDHIDLEQSHILADDYLFLAEIAEQLYRFIHECFKLFDPNHLLLGDKYLLDDHPRGVLEVAAKYVDVISIQPGPAAGPGPGPGVHERVFQKELFDQINEVTNKPILICDHQTSFYTKLHPVTLWHQFATADSAMAQQEQFISHSAVQPYIIGYQRCQYLDYYDSERGLLKQGLVDMHGKNHEPFHSKLGSVNKQIVSNRRRLIGILD